MSVHDPQKPDEIHFIEADEIAAVLKCCKQVNDAGKSAYSDYTFEEGIETAILWLIGEGPHPLGRTNENF